MNTRVYTVLFGAVAVVVGEAGFLVLPFAIVGLIAAGIALWGHRQSRRLSPCYYGA